ncbi:MAG: hypothetical protein ABSG53_27605 [Thermoguttaceae bacterium]|jgi:hypothetical protein
MNRILLSMLMFALPLVSTLCVAAEPSADQAKAIAEIEKIGGKVTVDEKSPGKPAIEVTFWGTQVTDAGLGHLNGLTKLQSLDLGETKVTDAGLIHLKAVPQLITLGLRGTQVTDAGLVHLNPSFV